MNLRDRVALLTVAVDNLCNSPNVWVDIVDILENTVDILSDIVHTMEEE